MFSSKGSSIRHYIRGCSSAQRVRTINNTTSKHTTLLSAVGRGKDTGEKDRKNGKATRKPSSTTEVHANIDNPLKNPAGVSGSLAPSVKKRVMKYSLEARVDWSRSADEILQQQVLVGTLWNEVQDLGRNAIYCAPIRPCRIQWHGFQIHTSISKDYPEKQA